MFSFSSNKLMLYLKSTAFISPDGTVSHSITPGLHPRLEAGEPLDRGAFDKVSRAQMCIVEFSICIAYGKITVWPIISRPQYLGRGCSLDNDCVLFYLCGHNVVIPRECIQIYTLSAIMCFWRIVYIHRYVWTRNVRCVFAQTKQWEHSINPQPAHTLPLLTLNIIMSVDLIYPTLNMFTLLSAKQTCKS